MSSPQTSPVNAAVLLLMLTTLMWGGNGVAGKFAVGHVSPLLLTSMRWMIASVLLLILARRHLRTDWPIIKQRLAYLFCMGAIGFAVFNGLLYTALHHTTAVNAAILQGAMPMMIFVLNFVAFRVATTWAQAVGYALTLIGVLLTAAAGNLDQLMALDVNVGDLLMLAAGALYAAYSVFLRSKPDIHWLSFLCLLVVSAALAAIPMALYEATTADFIWPSTVTGWSVVAFTALFPSILAQGAYIRGVEVLGGNAAGLFLNLVPIFGVLLAVLMLGEVFNFHHAVAMVLVVGGIVIAQRFGRPA